MMEALLSLPDFDMEEIKIGLKKLHEVSSYLNFPFTFEEVARYFLPSSNITGDQLRELLSSDKFKNFPFLIRDGYLFAHPTQSISSRLERERLSSEKLASAAEFAAVLSRSVPFIKTVAVTGSVAYGSAERWDDIDLFIVTARNRLWISALMTLILVRIGKLLGIREPHLSPFCLSYIHDEQGFADESIKNRTNPLFARELIKAKPVTGMSRYRKMLKDNDWVAKFYATSYVEKMRSLEKDQSGSDTETAWTLGRLSILFDLVEGMAFTFLSRYLRLRAYLTNLRFKSKGQDFRIFEPKISSTSCIYTSNFYRWLYKLWGTGAV
jgi:hypothetical protein